MNIKKFIALLLSFSICSNCAVSAIAADASSDQYTLNTPLTSTVKFEENYEKANNAFTNLTCAFFEAENTSTTARSNVGYTVNGVSASGYPDYYAGAYVNSNGNLVVLIDDEVKSNSILRSSAQIQAENNISTLSESDDIIYGSAQHSYSELIDVMTEITNYCTGGDKSENEYTIQSYEIDDYNNCVNVYLNSVKEEAIEWFESSVCASECIKFKEKNNKIEGLSTALLGDYIDDGVNVFSVGFRAKTTSGTTKYGFVTCAHGFENLTSSVTVNGSNGAVGRLDTTRAQFSGNIDAAFCENYSSSTIIVNSVVTDSGGTYLMNTGGVLGPAQGGYVYSYGQTTDSVTGAIKTGYVMSLSASVPNFTGIWTDHYKTDLVMLKGDSGGPLFGYHGNGEYMIAGTVSAGDQSSETYYCKALNITSALGVFVY